MNKKVNTTIFNYILYIVVHSGTTPLKQQVTWVTPIEYVFFSQSCAYWTVRISQARFHTTPLKVYYAATIYFLIESYFNEYSYKLFENCNYYTDDSFNKYLAKHAISNNSFSVAHLNIRSIPANFSAFLSFIHSLDHCFTVIGLSETWLNPSNVSTYGISGYNHAYQTRCTSRGGGVSLFVSEKKCIFWNVWLLHGKWLHWILICKNNQ